MSQAAGAGLDRQGWREGAIARARAELGLGQEPVKSWEKTLLAWFERERLDWGLKPGAWQTRERAAREWEACLADPVGWALSRFRPKLLMQALLSAAPGGLAERSGAVGAPWRAGATEALFEIASGRQSAYWGVGEAQRAGAIAAALELGADPDALGRLGQRPLTACLRRVARDQEELEAALGLARECDAGPLSPEGACALEIACSARRKPGWSKAQPYPLMELCEWLVANGADPLAPGLRGMGPLRRAALAGNAELCWWLAGLGADLEARCLFGYSHEEALSRQGWEQNPAIEALAALRERQELADWLGGAPAPENREARGL